MLSDEITLISDGKDLVSFILIPKSGEDIKINAWNWRPTIALLRAANVITDALYERMGANGAGAIVDADLAAQIADFLQRHIQSMNPGDRMRYDLSVTSVPKKPIVFTPTTKPEDIDATEAYSATYEWLSRFKDFCRSSGGFEVS